MVFSRAKRVFIPESLFKLSLEELKYNTEQTAANTGPETQYKVA
jgi:hypothetical protein